MRCPTCGLSLDDEKIKKSRAYISLALIVVWVYNKCRAYMRFKKEVSKIEKIKGYKDLTVTQKKLLQELTKEVMKIICEENKEKIKVKEVKKYGNGVCCIFENDLSETFEFCKIDPTIFFM